MKYLVQKMAKKEERREKSQREVIWSYLSYLTMGMVLRQAKKVCRQN